MASITRIKSATESIRKKTPLNCGNSNQEINSSEPPLRTLRNKKIHPINTARYKIRGTTQTERHNITCSSSQREIDQIKITRLAIKVKVSMVCQNVLGDPKSSIELTNQ